MLGEFTKLESGRWADQSQLSAALALARRRRATLVIAKTGPACALRGLQRLIPCPRSCQWCLQKS